MTNSMEEFTAGNNRHAHRMDEFLLDLITIKYAQAVYIDRGSLAWVARSTAAVPLRNPMMVSVPLSPYPPQCRY